MTTNQSLPIYDVPEDSAEDSPLTPSASEAGTSADTGGRGGNSSGRRVRRRSVYKFPSYDFDTAFAIAREVEESGGGTLTDETLAVNLGLSKSSSGFRLKCLAARHFGLLDKEGASLTTTAVAKAIMKPTSDDDALRGYQHSFLSVPLFEAVAERYTGQRLPDSQTLRNVLEREFQVEPKRVQQAERLLLDSARATQLLKHEADGTYLVISPRPQDSEDDSWPRTDNEWRLNVASPPRVDSADRPVRAAPPNGSANVLSFSLDEIGQLSEEDFEPVWQAIGILVRARGTRRRSATEENGSQPPE